MSLVTFMVRPSSILVNILVTFVQAAVAYWMLQGFSTDKFVVAGAIGAGLSALWHLLFRPFLVSKGWLHQ